jgi:hypothetical protein
MSFTVAQNLSKFTDPEEGKWFNILFESQAISTCPCSWFVYTDMLLETMCFVFTYSIILVSYMFEE